MRLLVAGVLSEYAPPAAASKGRVGRRHTCTLCREAFRTATHLRRHVLSVHDRRQSPIVCTDCKQSFGREDSVHRHKSTGACSRRIAQRQALRLAWRKKRAAAAAAKAAVVAGPKPVNTTTRGAPCPTGENITRAEK